MSALTVAQREIPCPICSYATAAAGSLIGKTMDREFNFRSCAQCGYRYVENPATNLSAIYNEKYYRGEGADPLINYVAELEKPKSSVRQYEWRGVLQSVAALMPLTPETQWLDFGCGNGGQVRFIRENSPCRAVGFEEGWIAERARALGIPILKGEDLKACRGTFDIVTAVEVLEHIPDPVRYLQSIRALLRPGGILFLTTGNAAAHRENFLKWGYVNPEIHVSYFEPKTLEWAMQSSGFKAEFLGPLPGFSDVLRFKILKNLGIKNCNLFEKLMPWKLLSHLADIRYKASAHPIGRAI